MEAVIKESGAVPPPRVLLSDTDKAAYKRDGLIVAQASLAPTELAFLRDAAERLVADNPGIRPEGLDTSHIVNNDASPVKGSADILRFACTTWILDLVEQLIGPDIILWNTHLFCKPAGDGKEVPWHQDGHYWPIRPLATCSVWIALDDVSEENGALRWLPGSHTGQQFQHHTDNGGHLALNQVLDDGQVDLSKARTNTLKAGQFSLHDVYLLHGSAANVSTRRRSGLALRYMPATSLFDRSIRRDELSATFFTRPIWLVRGNDQAGNTMLQHYQE